MYMTAVWARMKAGREQQYLVDAAVDDQVSGYAAENQQFARIFP